MIIFFIYYISLLNVYLDIKYNILYLFYIYYNYLILDFLEFLFIYNVIDLIII